MYAVFVVKFGVYVCIHIIYGLHVALRMHALYDSYVDMYTVALLFRRLLASRTPRPRPPSSRSLLQRLAIYRFSHITSLGLMIVEAYMPACIYISALLHLIILAFGTFAAILY